MKPPDDKCAKGCETTTVGWWINFQVLVPGTTLFAEYSWGPYASEVEARVDARLVSAEVVEVSQRETSETDWKFPSYPPGSTKNG